MNGSPHTAARLFAAMIVWCAASESIGAASGFVAHSATIEPPRTAATNRILIDRSLRETPVRIVKLDTNTVTFVGIEEPPDAPPRSRPFGDLLAIVPSKESLPKTSFRSERTAVEARIVQIDGQRIVGHVGAPDQKESVSVVSGALGTITIPIDQILLVDVINPERPAVPEGRRVADDNPANTEDSVELSNGDRLLGFVESIGPVMTIKARGAADSTSIPIDRIVSMKLANAPKRAEGMRLWLADGSCLRIKSLGEPSESGMLVAVLNNDKGVTIPISQVAAACFDSAKIVPLAELAPSTYTPSPDRRWTRPPAVTDQTAPFGGSRLVLPGPMTVEWALPPGVTAFGAWAELAPSSESWGECSLSVEAINPDGATKPLATAKFTSDAPRARLDCPIAAGANRLRITLTSGSRGPILDRVTLERAFLLVGTR